MRYYIREEGGSLEMQRVEYTDPTLLEWAKRLRVDSPGTRTRLIGWPDQQVVECNSGLVLIPTRAARKLGII